MASGCSSSSLQDTIAVPPLHLHYTELLRVCVIVLLYCKRPQDMPNRLQVMCCRTATYYAIFWYGHEHRTEMNTDYTVYTLQYGANTQ